VTNLLNKQLYVYADFFTRKRVPAVLLYPQTQQVTPKQGEEAHLSDQTEVQ
jgi:hypothetical protein